jgi:glycosyltransferase involved in cell wall biosynthesis
MAALRVLHVTPYYGEAWAYGGIPRVVTALARGLANGGHRVVVATTDAGDADARLPATATTSDAGVEVRGFRNLSNRAAYRWQWFQPRGLGRFLRQLLRETAPGVDIAHLHGCHHLPGAIAARELRRAGVPYVLTPNGTGPRIERRRAAKWVFDHTLGRAVLPGAALVTAVSEAERRQLLAMGVPAGKLRLLPNPLDLDELATPPARGAFRARWGLGGAPVVLYLGMLTPRKGVDVLIEAFAHAQLPGARLVIAGNDRGVGAALRRRAHELNVNGATTFTGLLRGDERLAALTDADVVVYPSRDEAFGLVPLESLLCGTPVVVSDDHGCGEVIAAVGGGLRVPPGDAAALAAALREVLGNAERWRREAAAVAGRVRERFGADVVCARLEQIYAEAVATIRERVAAATTVPGARLA